LRRIAEEKTGITTDTALRLSGLTGMRRLPPTRANEGEKTSWPPGLTLRHISDTVTK
jgi:hypothetical protein